MILNHCQDIRCLMVCTHVFDLMQDVTVIFRRRGGDDLVQNHSHWAKTVSFSPDVIEMTFLPITYLLDGVPGKDHLIRAITLYLECRYLDSLSRDLLLLLVISSTQPLRQVSDSGFSADKPPIEELRYFLEFQIPRIWAPVRENLPGHQRKEPVCPHLQFSIMGQKLYVSQEQVFCSSSTGYYLSWDNIAPVAMNLRPLLEIFFAHGS